MNNSNNEQSQEANTSMETETLLDMETNRENTIRIDKEKSRENTNSGKTNEEEITSDNDKVPVTAILNSSADCNIIGKKVVNELDLKIDDSSDVEVRRYGTDLPLDELVVNIFQSKILKNAVV
ncbi:hypothetical protein Glove_199g94 [Diversispora epigaea]|uniref:Aspartic peptidase DDI1-type domain-containing protein n=1 Tax=Diversispora epigaea TaxID=1348612 RepID=A0A397IJW8_9GLOM|nr:hypothetical protein Glove_199g94 [Diversispora epigaea]